MQKNVILVFENANAILCSRTGLIICMGGSVLITTRTYCSCLYLASPALSPFLRSYLVGPILGTVLIRPAYSGNCLSNLSLTALARNLANCPCLYFVLVT